MTTRETAIRNARALAQQIFEDQYTLFCRRAYYVERDGQITTDEFVGNAHERQSVYFDEPGCAVRLATYGLNGIGYNGADEDYSDDGGATVCDWRDRDVDDPSDEIVEKIEAIPTGFFADETAIAA